LRANFEEPKNIEEEKKEEAVEKYEGVNIELWVEPGPVWVSVLADEKLVFSGNILAGGLQIFKAKEKIVVSSGKANATFVKLNGKDFGTLGKDSGTAKDIIFTADTKF
jgi:hypothetical protein